jgi:hypothetical protein
LGWSKFHKKKPTKKDEIILQKLGFLPHGAQVAMSGDLLALAPPMDFWLGGLFLLLLLLLLLLRLLLRCIIVYSVVHRGRERNKILLIQYRKHHIQNCSVIISCLNF